MFESHEEADQARVLHPYRPSWDDEHWHLPWPLTLGNPVAEIERHARRQNRELNVEASVISPEEAFKRLEERGLA